ncbi:MAG TPA: hypothetical protein VKA31_11315 [Mariprofundaceae bacterium]|nr:hypothetical protein [Mariprofundaceae bacterium]
MTISSEVNAVKYDGDDSTTGFAFTFTVNEPDTGVDHDLEAIKISSAGAETTLSEGTGTTDYSVTVAAYPGAGSITYPATGGGTLATGDSIVIRRKQSLTQATNLENQGGYLPDVLEFTLDDMVRQIQDLKEEIDRCLQIKVGDKEVNAADPDLPLMVAGEYLVVNATGDGFELTGSTTTAATASSATPQDVTAAGGSAGVSTDYSRADHVHDIGTAADVVSDTTPQLGGNLDANGQNILIDSTNFIGDEGGNEQVIFNTTASAINQIEITNAATTNGPEIKASGDDTDVDLVLSPQGAGILSLNGPVTLGGDLDVGSQSIVSSAAGDITITPDTTGDIILDGQKWPQADGTAGQALITDGAGQLAWQNNRGVQYTATTTTATPTVIASGSIAADTAMVIHAEGVCRDATTSVNATGFEVHNAVLNDGGTSANGTQTGDIIDITPWSTDIQITANDTTDQYEVTITGVAATTIDWVVNVYFEVV